LTIKNFYNKLIINFLTTFVFITLGLAAYAKFVLQIPFYKQKTLVSEGVFPYSVAITGIIGFLMFKYNDIRKDQAGIRGALGAMIIWFLWMLLLKFVV